jgi:acyl-CoA thioester hydrolase
VNNQSNLGCIYALNVANVARTGRKWRKVNCGFGVCTRSSPFACTAGCGALRDQGNSRGGGRVAHRFDLRVYYEDTDLAGIVYYANYLKFIERARSEWVRGLGVDQARLRSDLGIVFAVRRVVADYLAPAVFDDLLQVVSAPKAVTGARIVLDQRVMRADQLLFQAEVTLVCLAAVGQAIRIPTEIRSPIAAAIG